MVAYLSDMKRSRRPALSCPTYHPRCELAHRTGYFPHLSAAHKDAVQQIKAKLKAGSMALSASTEDENLRILRFLRAREFNVNESFTMIREHIEWERAVDFPALRHRAGREVLSCDLDALFDICPWWFQGTDRQARPLLWGHAGGLEVWRMTQLAPLEDVVHLYMWGCAQLDQQLAHQSTQAGCNIETAVVIIDVAGWNLGLATKEAFALIRAVTTAASSHFPERLGHLLVINAPSVLSFAWKVISGFLDHTTRNKVQIFNHCDEWGPVLRELAEDAQVPRKYGGSAADLTREEALATLDTFTTSSSTRTIAVADFTATPSSSRSMPVDNSRVASAITQQNALPQAGQEARVAPLSSSNLTIISSKQHRRRDAKNFFETFSDARFATVGDIGRWLSQTLQLSTGSAKEVRRSRRRRGNRLRSGSGSSSQSDSSCSVVTDEDGASDRDMDSSVRSFGTSDSRGSSSGSSSVYDEEGGNVLHCRREDNLTPLPPSPHDATSWMDARWMFDAATQTDVSSFDAKFLSPCAGDRAKHLFTCFRKTNPSLQKKKE